MPFALTVGGHDVRSSGGNNVTASLFTFDLSGNGSGLPSVSYDFGGETLTSRHTRVMPLDVLGRTRVSRMRSASLSFIQTSSQTQDRNRDGALLCLSRRPAVVVLTAVS